MPPNFQAGYVVLFSAPVGKVRLDPTFRPDLADAGTVPPMGNRRRRPNPNMTPVIAGAVMVQLVTVLDWLSQYPGRDNQGWQIPALSGATLLTGRIAISQSGAARKRANKEELGLP